MIPIPISIKSTAFTALGAVLAGTAFAAPPYMKGDISPDFTLPRWEDGEPMRLSDFAGHVIVIDFFAFWCPPCSFASPDVEENVFRHYEERGGNPAGVPVTVISANIEPEDPASTQAFIDRNGLSLVLDDSALQAWDLYNDTGGIPLFVVVKGVQNAEGAEPWEILHNEAGYPGAPFLRNIIDSIRPAEDTAPPLFASLDEDENGWRHSPWFGPVWSGPPGWLFHPAHGFIRPAPGACESDLPFYDPQTEGWLWTNNDLYPFVYDSGESEWLYFPANGPPLRHTSVSG